MAHCWSAGTRSAWRKPSTNPKSRAIFWYLPRSVFKPEQWWETVSIRWQRQRLLSHQGNLKDRPRRSTEHLAPSLRGPWYYTLERSIKVNCRVDLWTKDHFEIIAYVKTYIHSLSIELPPQNGRFKYAFWVSNVNGFAWNLVKLRVFRR